MEKSHVTYRISPFLWLDDARFEELLEELDANRDGFDDAALFTGFVHSPISLATMAERCAILPERLNALRAHGFGAGINLLCAIGFFPENLEDVPAGIPHFTYFDGQENAGSFCPNSEIYQRDYLAPVLTMLARTGPDFIWLDDDHRGNCLCDDCLARFNAATGHRHSRETLPRALNTGTPAEQVAARREFLAFSSRNLTDHYARVEKTVHAVSPAIVLGGMDVMGDCWDDADFPAWTEALAGPNHAPVRWRPGGGTYTDREPDGFILDKGMRFALDAAWMPDTLTDRRSEIENFTYQRLKKSRHATALEACIYNACGMTGVAWNVLDAVDDLAIYRPLLRHLTRVRPFFDAQVRANGVETPRGIWNGWTRTAGAAMGFDGNWEWHDKSLLPNPHNGELFVAGFAAAFRPDAAEATILAGPIARTLDDDAVERILAGGLYCDVETLQILTERGFASQLGFRAVENTPRDLRERLTGHPLNGDGAHHVRDCRQSFTHGAGWRLEALDGRGESLAELIDYRDRVIAPCTIGLYRNDLGGRVAVAGYYPLQELSFAYKIGQLKRLFDFLSDRTLSGWIESYHKIALWFRPGTVSLVNASLDPAEQVELRWRTDRTEAELLGMYGETRKIHGTPQPDRSMRFELPRLEPYHAYLIR